jgi:prepilin-type N-terminal cleavage/methylation domain-containing protein
MRKGFTLVELLIVIAILSILSTLGVSNFQSARIKARDIARKSDLATIAKSLEAYVNDHRSYPLSNSSNKIICNSPNICDWGAPFSDGTTLYTSTLPREAKTTQQYIYVSDGQSFSLYAHLENTNDPAIQSFNPVIKCGTPDCNYIISSSNK